MRSLYLAVKLRRFGVLVSSAVGTTGAKTRAKQRQIQHPAKVVSVKA
jgi:hypothetical protein